MTTYVQTPVYLHCQDNYIINCI